MALIYCRVPASRDAVCSRKQHDSNPNQIRRHRSWGCSGVFLDSVAHTHGVCSGDLFSRTVDCAVRNEKARKIRSQRDSNQTPEREEGDGARGRATRTRQSVWDSNAERWPRRRPRDTDDSRTFESYRTGVNENRTREEAETSRAQGWGLWDEDDEDDYKAGGGRDGGMGYFDGPLEFVNSFLEARLNLKWGLPMIIVMIPLTFDRPLWLVVLPSIITFVPPVRNVLGPPLQDLWLAALQLANQPIWTTNKEGAGGAQKVQRERREAEQGGVRGRGSVKTGSGRGGAGGGAGMARGGSGRWQDPGETVQGEGWGGDERAADGQGGDRSAPGGRGGESRGAGRNARKYSGASSEGGPSYAKSRLRSGGASMGVAHTPPDPDLFEPAGDGGSYRVQTDGGDPEPYEQLDADMRGVGVAEQRDGGEGRWRGGEGKLERVATGVLGGETDRWHQGEVATNSEEEGRLGEKSGEWGEVGGGAFSTRARRRSREGGGGEREGHPGPIGKPMMALPPPGEGVASWESGDGEGGKGFRGVYYSRAYVRVPRKRAIEGGVSRDEKRREVNTSRVRVGRAGGLSDGSGRVSALRVGGGGQEGLGGISRQYNGMNRLDKKTWDDEERDREEGKERDEPAVVRSLMMVFPFLRSWGGFLK